YDTDLRVCFLLQNLISRWSNFIISWEMNNFLNYNMILALEIEKALHKEDQRKDKIYHTKIFGENKIIDNTTFIIANNIIHNKWNLIQHIKIIKKHRKMTMNYNNMNYNNMN
ncbi:hypothetical protein ACJX0J_014293, partial [Zea mays]